MSRFPLFCKTCGSKKVYWDSYFDDRGYKKFVLRDYITNLPHNETCTIKKEDAIVRHKI